MERLREIFPFHSQQQLDAALRDAGGDIGAAGGRLLETDVSAGSEGNSPSVDSLIHTSPSSAFYEDNLCVLLNLFPETPWDILVRAARESSDLDTAIETALSLQLIKAETRFREPRKERKKLQISPAFGGQTPPSQRADVSLPSRHSSANAAGSSSGGSASEDGHSWTRYLKPARNRSHRHTAMSDEGLNLFLHGTPQDLQDLRAARDKMLEDADEFRQKASAAMARKHSSVLGRNPSNAAAVASHYSTRVRDSYLGSAHLLIGPGF